MSNHTCSQCLDVTLCQILTQMNVLGLSRSAINSAPGIKIRSVMERDRRSITILKTEGLRSAVLISPVSYHSKVKRSQQILMKFGKRHLGTFYWRNSDEFNFYE